MNSPHTFFATSMPKLGDELARLLRQPHGEPFKRDLIIIDGKASVHWLSHYLVRNAQLPAEDTKYPAQTGLGIHMNAKLVNTQLFHQEIARMLLGENLLSEEPDDLTSLPFRIFQKLQLGRKGFEYLTEGTEPADQPTLLWNAAARIADWIKELNLNDPSWGQRVQNGQKGPLEDLWREVRKEMEATLLTPLEIIQALANKASLEAVANHLPGRIFLFATGETPQSVLDLLKALSPAIQINALFLQPTEGYYLDLRNELKSREGLKRIPKEDRTQQNPGALLLVQTGKHYATVMKRLIDDDFWCPQGESVENPTEINQGKLLSRLQNSIKYFDANVTPLTYEKDNSLTLHRCHTALREAEVLRDQLLGILADNPHLSASDVLILTPDPDTYAPLLAGVLGGTTPAFSFGTVAIEGAHQSQLGALAQKLLNLPAGRLTSQEFLDFCDQKIIRDLYHWDDSTLTTLRYWMKDAPYFWGASEKHRKAKTEVSDYKWSLDYFIRCIVLGTALADDATVTGTPSAMPIAGIKSIEDLRHAADLLKLAETIKDWAEFSIEQHSLEQWTKYFGEKLLDLVPDYDTYSAVEVMAENILASLQKDAAWAKETPLDHAAFTTIALPYFELGSAKGQFMSGRTTLAPLRTANLHPSKVIALVGMSDGSFPAGNKPHGRELQTAIPTPAQPYREQSEQRGMHTLLQIIAAATDHLIITYQGYAGDTGKDAPAAMPIEILRQACEKLAPDFKTYRHAPLAIQAGETLEEKSKAHHLDETRTFDPLHTKLAQTEIQDGAQPKVTIDVSHLSLDAWIAFWGDPVRHGLETFHIKPTRQNEELDSDEVISLQYGRSSKKPHEIEKLIENWAKRFNRTRQRLPNELLEPNHSGVVPNDQASREKYHEILVKLEEELQGTPEDFDDEVIPYHANAQRVPLPTTHYSAAYSANNCLILCLNKKTIKERDLLQGIAALAWLRNKPDFVNINSVAVIAPREGDNDKGKPQKLKGLGAKPKDLNQCNQVLNELMSKMLQLSRKAITPDYFLGYNTTEAAFKGALSEKPDAGASEKNLDDQEGRGDIAKDGVARLVNPNKFDFESMNKAVKEVFGDFERYTATKINDMISGVPQETKKTKAKK